VKRHSDAIREEIAERTLDAISSLKRMLNAKDALDYPDRVEGHYVHVYTDSSGAQVLEQLFRQFQHVDDTEARRGGERVKPNSDLNSLDVDGTHPGVFHVEFYLPPERRILFVKRLDDYMEKHLAPTKRPGRER